MSKNYLFINTNTKKIRNKILIPNEIEIYSISIIGLYLDTCIRFYKEGKNYQIIKDRKIKRIICASSQYFDINNNYLSISTNDSLIKEYDFSSGVILVNCDEYFDLVEKNNLKLYMKNNYFKTIYEDIVLGNEKTIMTRYTDEKPPIHIKLLSMDKKTTSA